METIMNNTPASARINKKPTTVATNMAMALAFVLGAATHAQAQVAQILYEEDFGAAYATTNATIAGTMQSIGWTNVGGQYIGTYNQGGNSFDIVSGITLSNRPCYVSSSIASDASIIYTTDGAGSGTNGTAAFAAFDPSTNSGLTLAVFSQTSNPNNVAGQVSNYFAVQIGGNWYVSVALITNTVNSGNIFALTTLVYNPASGNWNNLTVGGSVSIGGPAGALPSGLITGIGIVQTWAATLSGTPGFNYQNYRITRPYPVSGAGVAPVVNGWGRSQTNYTGATVSFTIGASVGTTPFNYSWSYNGGAPLSDGLTANGSTIYGSGTSQLTISNIQPADAGIYSGTVANGTGSDTDLNHGQTNYLAVLTPGPELLYSELFPFIGPYETGESLTGVGWKATISAARSPSRVDERGDVYAYERSAISMGFFTGTNLDVGQSGVAFPPAGINPANYPFVSFRATYGAASGGGLNPNNALVYFAVEMAGGHWFVSRSANLLAGAPAATTNSYGLAFAADNTQWNVLTIGNSSVTVGSTASPGALAGNIYGVGLVLVYTGPALYQITSVSLVTNSTPPVAPSFPSLPNVPYPQTVYAGGGASFSFTEAGTPPFTNHWDFNQSGIFLVDGLDANGSIISGSGTTFLTIQNVSTNDGGGYRGVVSNPGGTNTTDTGTFGVTPLTVLVPPVGLIYSESFPLYVVPNGNQPLSIIGWTNQSDTPNRIFKIGAATVGAGAAYAYEGVTTNSLFYAATETDTGFSGLPFIAFDPANYPSGSIGFSAGIALGNPSYTSVSVSIAVRIAGQWYVNATPLVPTNSSLTGTYTVIGPQTYDPTAANWQLVTFVGAQGVVIGGTPPQNLKGPITAAGLLFRHYGTAGGSINYNSLTIQATGVTGDNLIGGLNIGPAINGQVTLTWVGNPAVKLQSTGSLSPTSWTDVPNTAGAHSYTVTPSGVKFYRITGPAVP
jgi:hypothetical protein